MINPFVMRFIHVQLRAKWTFVHHALGALVDDRPLSTRERNTHLAIMAALCKELQIDYSRHAKAAATIKAMMDAQGLNVGESTIEGYLKRIPDALEARSR